jgi:hypothetical protein
MNVTFRSSNPMILPVLLTSVSWAPKFVLVKGAEFTCTAVNFSVCAAGCALAAAGSASAAALPRTTAAPAAAMVVWIFMVALLCVEPCRCPGNGGGSCLTDDSNWPIAGAPAGTGQTAVTGWRSGVVTRARLASSPHTPTMTP